MTLIRLKMSRPSSSGKDVPAKGGFRVSPTRLRVVDGDPATVILPAEFIVPVPETGLLDLELAATGPGWCWRLSGYDFGVPSWVEYVAVPEPVPDPDRPGEFLPVDYPDLIRVDPKTLEPSAEPDPAWWAALEASGGGGTGQAGPAGPAGPAGADGADGAAGPAGPAGADGAAGPAGPAGADGAAGPAGPAGADGADGADGAAGPAGPAGADGAAGPAGPAGADGADGPAGPQGKPGSGGGTAVRVDQTAGRALYAWDELNNREQRIYGDTGTRDMSTNLLNQWAGPVTLRRIGNTVRIGLYGLNGTNRTGGIFLAIPLGFQPQNAMDLGTFVNATTGNDPSIKRTYGSGTTHVAMNGVAAGNVFVGSISYDTVDPWPTTLPGTALGIIPHQ